MKHLQIEAGGSMLVITSAGDNVLHYAIEGSHQKVSGLYFDGQTLCS